MRATGRFDGLERFRELVVLRFSLEFILQFHEYFHEAANIYGQEHFSQKPWLFVLLPLLGMQSLTDVSKKRVSQTFRFD